MWPAVLAGVCCAFLLRGLLLLLLRVRCCCCVACCSRWSFVAVLLRLRLVGLLPLLLFLLLLFLFVLLLLLRVSRQGHSHCRYALMTTATSIRLKKLTLIPNICVSPSISRFSTVSWQSNGTRKRLLTWSRVSSVICLKDDCREHIVQ